MSFVGWIWSAGNDDVVMLSLWLRTLSWQRLSSSGSLSRCSSLIFFDFFSVLKMIV